MRTEQRKKKRRPLRQNAWVTAGKGAPLIACSTSDISESGARIALENAADLPENFLLMFTTNGNPIRWCRAVWRSANQIGVSFEKMTAAQAERILPALRARLARSGDLA
jgi:hypothetical protein